MNGFSLQNLSDVLNNKVTRQALHKYEKGEVLPDSEMMEFLCEALKVIPTIFLVKLLWNLGKLDLGSWLNIRQKNKTA